MGLTHIGALPPFILDGIPCLLCSSGSFDSQSSGVSTVESNVALDKLVTEIPLIVTRAS